jgi:geranylgeranyl pyrophosphate synthase
MRGYYSRGVHSDFTSALPKDIKRCLGLTLSRIVSFRREDFVVNELFRPSVHLLNGSGKLLRPSLLFLGAHAIGANCDGLVDLAAATELLHVSSLMHDDIIDNGRFRRGRKAVNVVYGDSVALLAGNALISKAIQLSSVYGKDVMRALSDAALQMSAGELMDYSVQKSGSAIGVRRYLRIAELKTASLTGVACSMAATYKKNRAIKKLYSYGANLGIAFQIRDDMLDFAEPGRNRDSIISMTNIVASIKREKGVSTADAMREAAELNRSYVRRAVTEVRGSAAEALEPYARMIEADRY